MTGIFGTGASLEIDINLILQIAAFLILVASLVYKNKNKFKMHAISMGIAVILHVLSYIAVMGPIFFSNWGIFVDYISYAEIQTTWIHAIPGAAAMILGVLLVGLWALKPSNIAACTKRKRLMDVTVLLWLISLVIFGITQILPGDAAFMVLGQWATDEGLEKLRLEMGLDRPLWAQYGGWLTDFARGDFGKSLTMRLPARPIVMERLANSAVLGILAFVEVAFLGIILGVICGIRKDSWFYPNKKPTS